MNKDAAAATFFARIFYGIMHAFILLICFTYENDLLTSCDSGAYSCFQFLGLKVFAIYLFFTVSRKKSFVETTTEFPPCEWEKPPQIYCEYCNITPGYRVRHCKKCEKCISLYDHHCFWVGCCIGELNRVRFCFYLLTESFCIWWVFFSSFSGLIEDSEGYGGFVVTISITGVFATLTSSLGLYQFYLISICSTTWESLSRQKISYFKPYPSNFNPFSKGCWENWKTAILSSKISHWDLPQPLYIYPFNWCDNEYWSCC